MINYDGNLYLCSCSGNFEDVDNCTVCEGYGLLLATPKGPVALSRVEPRPLVAMMSVRIATMERSYEALKKRLWEIERDIGQRSENENEYMSNLHEQNRMLRYEVRTLAKQMGMKPANVEGEPWVPQGTRGVLGMPSQENSPLEAVRAMVKQHVADATDETAFSPEHIHRYVDDIIGANIESLVKKHLGLDTMGRIDRGPLKDALTNAINEIDLTGYARDAVKELDVEAELPDYLRETAGDEFRQELRNTVRQMARDRAETLARDCIREVIEQAVLDEMPWLKRYLATKRLGGGQDGDS